MSVRRQLDAQYGSVSLTHLLHEIESRPDIDIGISSTEVVSDRQAIQRDCAQALMFAQRQLAHRAPWTDPSVSMREMDGALDSLSRLVRKYYLKVSRPTDRRLRLTIGSINCEEGG